MVDSNYPNDKESSSAIRRVKKWVGFPLSLILRRADPLREKWLRFYNHALLASRIHGSLSETVVVLGKINVYGTRNIRFEKDALLYPNLHLETQENGIIDIGDRVVLSTGVHLVSMARVCIGSGTLIGEYASIRDANHVRRADSTIRDAGHAASPITIGKEVWIGRGVTVLQGVTIGDGATIGANAVVTRDVPPGETVVGIPAHPIRKKAKHSTLESTAVRIEDGGVVKDIFVYHPPDIGSTGSHKIAITGIDLKA
jgi:acetyltransferase-like isoleucine patch superfamily enzyme